MKKILRLGTRSSPLALIQAEDVRQKLFQANPELVANHEVEIIPIRTTGDWKPENKERSFIELGGNKGLFTKEIEDGLLTGHIDLAVHSMKDVATWLPDGLEIAALLERIDPRDAFISNIAHTMDELKPGAIIGTCSLRRQAQILARRPDLRIVSLRGNVDTRLKKLAQGVADATLLAVAGMVRLGVSDRISSIMEPAVMLPAAAQGALGIEIRKGDDFMRRLLAPLNHHATSVCVIAERALLKALDGSCYTPIGALGRLTDGNRLILEGMVAKPDGTSIVRMDNRGPLDQGEAIGSELGNRMKAELPLDFFAT
jgi:hydroxymethylbilane synthase